MTANNKGYTLIEILIVIVIIGVLAAIAYPNLVGLTESSKQEVVTANLRTLLTEIEVHAAQEDGYPALDTEDFISNPEGWNSLVKIVEEIGDDETLYNYDSDNDNFVFSIELPNGEFIGISKSDGLQTDTGGHLDL